MGDCTLGAKRISIFLGLCLVVKINIACRVIADLDLIGTRQLINRGVRSWLVNNLVQAILSLGCGLISAQEIDRRRIPK